ncbi:MAG: FRG domain-containing protein [Helicobacteraceae bacterium]|jgi:hypothetical protein|nr:FRG domain-containing protein [Helicobacteraceae bacterium]
MGIEIKNFNSSKETMKFLESLALSDADFIFRGQPNPNVKISTSLHRVAGVQTNEEIKDLLRRFETALAKIGIFPFERASRLDWLEYARHCGVPLPVIDFTYSPYVALFFAFNQMDSKASSADSLDNFVSVLALNTKSLAKAWMKSANLEFNDNSYQQFKNAQENQFEGGFKADILQLIPFPGKKNKRMMRQMGLLLYDTLDYKSLGFLDMEDFLEKSDDDGENSTLIKMNIHKQCAHSVFERLELMNITGSQLFLDEHGAAMDVINSYFYRSRIHFRDLDNR